jgi:predicted nucleic acid-binding protein
MSGTKYLLDTNFILGILKSNAQALVKLSTRRILAGECSYSAITRMELLGFHRITQEEETLIRQKLEHFSYLPLTKDIEDRVISLRQSRKIKLPDAIIAATALCSGTELLTLDQHLLTVVHSDTKLA